MAGDIHKQMNMQAIRNATKILVFDGAQNIEIEPDQSILLMKNFETEKLLKNFGIASSNSIYQ